MCWILSLKSLNKHKKQYAQRKMHNADPAFEGVPLGICKADYFNRGLRPENFAHASLPLKA